MLCAWLNSHPDILCHHEIFNPEGIFYALDLRDGAFSLGTTEERDRNPLAFLNRIWQFHRGYSCVGFKLTHRQQETIFRAVLKDPHLKTIILRRKNRIKTYVSWLIAKQIGQWEVYRECDLIRERPKVELDLAALRAHLAYNEDYYAEIDRAMRSSTHRCLTTTYEDLFSVAEQRRILSFLGVSPNAVGQRVTSVKQNSKNVKDLVSNFAEIAAALRGTDLERELYGLDF
jgi:hypothetical protein